jgi:hypothetical protein
LKVGGMVAALLMLTTGCKLRVDQESPVDFELTMPEPGKIVFEAELKKKLGLNLDAAFPIKDFGTIRLIPESADHGFGLGFDLNSRAFLRGSWSEFQETTTLPTGAGFPAMFDTAVVDVQIPELNSRDVQWHIYLGTRGKFLLGVAAQLPAVGRDFPAVNLGYTFVDAKNRQVLAISYYGPKKDSAGKVVVPGGIFVGTNISTFLPNQNGATPSTPVLTQSAASRRLIMTAMSAVEKVESGQTRVNVHGRSVAADLELSGKDYGDYASKKKLQKLIGRYHAVMR